MTSEKLLQSVAVHIILQIGKNFIVVFCMALWPNHSSITIFGWYSLTIFLPTYTQLQKKVYTLSFGEYELKT